MRVRPIAGSASGEMTEELAGVPSVDLVLKCLSDVWFEQVGSGIQLDHVLILMIGDDIVINEARQMVVIERHIDL